MDRIRKTVLVRESTCAESMMDGIKYQLFNKGRRVKQTMGKAAVEVLEGRQEWPCVDVGMTLKQW